ncbi:MAG: hypothetical protein AAGA85_01565 [Bacteroidota bacterium]
MKEKSEEQVDQWLKKLERESWQLELLVSAFTIFLLLGAQQSFGDFIAELSHQVYGYAGFAVFVLTMIQASIIALTAFLIIHLLLRGFWIGAIGLRSVQPSIDYQKLNYSDLFQEKLKKKLIGLDRLVIILDELCSVIFSVSFLIIFMIFSFGLYFLFLALFSALLDLLFYFKIVDFAWVRYAGIAIFLLILLTGLIYFIDYFTLGFFKRFKKLSKLYYPIYRFYSAITLSFISRSIYYNLISKYSKRRIRLLLTLFLISLMAGSLISFDQYKFFPNVQRDHVFVNNYYDDRRDENEFVEKVSIASQFISEDFVSLFIRYSVKDNQRIQSNCPDFTPLKTDGLNLSLKFRFKNGLNISGENFEEEDLDQLLGCLSAFYEVSINDSIYTDLNYYFAEHPAKNQKGIQAVISSRHFIEGENTILIKQKYIDGSDSTLVSKDFARIPFWFSGMERTERVVPSPVEKQGD